MSLGSGASQPDDPAVLAIRAELRPVVERLSAGDVEGGTRLFADAILGPGVGRELPEALKQVMLANAATFVDEERALDNGALDTTHLPTVPTPADARGRRPTRPSRWSPSGSPRCCRTPTA